MHAWAGVLEKSPRPNSAVARPNSRGDPAAGAVLAPLEPPQVATTPSFLEAAHRAFSMPLPRPPGRRNPVQRGEGSPQRHRGLGPTPEVGRTRHPGAASSAHNHDTPAQAAPPDCRGALPRPAHVHPQATCVLATLNAHRRQQRRTQPLLYKAVHGAQWGRFLHARILPSDARVRRRGGGGSGVTSSAAPFCTCWPPGGRFLPRGWAPQLTLGATASPKPGHSAGLGRNRPARGGKGGAGVL